MNYYRLFSKVYQRAAQKMCLDCQGFIQKGSKILDLGCGSGIVAKNFEDFFRARVVGVDIRDRRVFPIPFQIINGKNLPFPDNSFDAVLISYVLHHSKDPLSLLKEAKRVSEKIIIYEDLPPEDFLSNVICKIHDLTFDRFFQHQKVQVSFKSEEEWEKIFNSLNLSIFHKKRIKSLYPVKKIQFVLRKK
jgi:ubiquinone/menaquinone biosynthesis C-methylase UbiE